MGFTGRIRRFTVFVSFLSALLVAETAWYAFSGTMSADKAERKRSFVAMTGLPDLAVATEARFLRFRSLGDPYSPFNEGPELLDYFPASFTYAPSGTEKLIPSRIANP